MVESFASDNERDLLTRAHELLLRSELTVSVAESCTGGLLGAALTETAGSSAYFLGGVLAYADGVKVNVLAVDERTIAAHGAVSGPVAVEMANAARRLTGSDIAISITGIAGPAGGTDQKPVGTTYIGVSGLGSEHTLHYVWQGNRAENRAASVRAALEVLVQMIERNVAAVSDAPIPWQHAG